MRRGISQQQTLQHTPAKVFGEKTKKGQYTLTSEALSKLDHHAKELEISMGLLLDALIRVGLDNAIAYYKQQSFKPTESKIAIKQRHGSIKSATGFNLTLSSHKSLNSYARKYKESRSEILECLIRAGCWQQAQELITQLINVKSCN